MPLGFQDTTCISLDSPNIPEYTALSYVWAKPAPPGKHVISIHGSLVDITPNLHNVLDSISQLEDLSSQWW